MKKIYVALLAGLCFAGCEIDNFEVPGLTLSGRIVDSETNELVESGGINSGTLIQLFEYSDTQPQTLQTLPDGTFTNSRVFAGNYTYTAIGPFTLVNSERVPLQISADTDIEIQVVPHVRLHVTDVSVSGTTATVKVRYEKVAGQQPLARIGLAWSTYRNPNVVNAGSGQFQEENVETLNLESGERVYTVTGLIPESLYYIRAFARTNNPGNYYNYSTQVEQEVN